MVCCWAYIVCIFMRSGNNTDENPAYSNVTSLRKVLKKIRAVVARCALSHSALGFPHQLVIFDSSEWSGLFLSEHAPI